MLDKKRKESIIKKFRVHENDSGSAEVQIAILNEEIKDLAEHLKSHKKDFSSRRGLLKKVGERRRLLRYLERENPDSFENLVKRLKLIRLERHQDLFPPPADDELELVEELLAVGGQSFPEDLRKSVLIQRILLS